MTTIHYEANRARIDDLHGDAAARRRADGGAPSARRRRRRNRFLARVLRAAGGPQPRRALQA